MFEIKGNKPMGDVLFASCDSKYFNNFGIPLLYSANDHEHTLHLHVINPTSDDIVTLKDLQVKKDFTYTIEQNNIQSLNVRLNQTYTFILYMLSVYDMI